LLNPNATRLLDGTAAERGEEYVLFCC
jgi:hypothetical protein